MVGPGETRASCICEDPNGKRLNDAPLWPGFFLRLQPSSEVKFDQKSGLGLAGGPPRPGNKLPSAIGVAAIDTQAPGFPFSTSIESIM
jgi:hypothetical protein